MKIFWMISSIHYKKFNCGGDLKDIHANYIVHPYCVLIHSPRHPSSALSIKMNNDRETSYRYNFLWI